MITDRLQALRKTYDNIIIDGPPVLLSSDARLIASHADAIIYAVRWAKTPLGVVARGLGALAGIGKPATGLVLSRVNMRRMRKLSSDPCVRAVHSPQAI
jgi:Mrp family chromosome partitioning ATPase